MKRRGFTIVELIIVITIMGALLVLNVVNLRDSQVSARDTERKTDIETIITHLDNFYSYGSDTSTSVGRYPSTLVTLTTAQAKVLVVGGGGGGGNNVHGGGGGGGVVYNPSFGLTQHSYGVIVGSGGAPGSSVNANGSNGNFSTFSDITAYGGGGGGANGASGGGGYTYNLGGTSIYSGQGNSGGNGYSNYSRYYNGGGGGGAAALGQNASSLKAGDGGIGVSSSISGTAQIYGSGGGGGWLDTSNTGSSINRGMGGTNAGNGGVSSGSTIIYSSTAAANNFGGGGGGGGWEVGSNNAGGTGGTGVVIVSYPTGSLTATGGNTILYTDSSNANPSITYQAGGYTIHIFTSPGTFTVTSLIIYNNNAKQMLRDIDQSSLISPNAASQSETFIPATNNIQTTAGVLPQPNANQYVYQPIQNDGSLCTNESQECRKFNLYYRLEGDNTVYMATGKNQ